MKIARGLSLMVIAALVATSCAVARGDTGRQVVGYFSDVGDLVSRATVQINDVKVGSVREVDLVLDRGEMVARVTMSIDDGVQVPVSGLAAVVRQTSLLGEQFVELVPEALARDLKPGMRLALRDPTEVREDLRHDRLVLATAAATAFAERFRQGSTATQDAISPGQSR